MPKIVKEESEREVQVGKRKCRIKEIVDSRIEATGVRAKIIRKNSLERIAYAKDTASSVQHMKKDKLYLTVFGR